MFPLENLARKELRNRNSPEQNKAMYIYHDVCCIFVNKPLHLSVTMECIHLILAQPKLLSWYISHEIQSIFKFL